VEQPWVTEAPAKLTFETGDRVQVLRGSAMADRAETAANYHLDFVQAALGYGVHAGT